MNLSEIVSRLDAHLAREPVNDDDVFTSGEYAAAHTPPIGVATARRRLVELERRGLVVRASKQVWSVNRIQPVPAWRMAK